MTNHNSKNHSHSAVYTNNNINTHDSQSSLVNLGQTHALSQHTNPSQSNSVDTNLQAANLQPAKNEILATSQSMGYSSEQHLKNKNPLILRGYLSLNVPKALGGGRNVQAVKMARRG
jgi:hypothetical protein